MERSGKKGDGLGKAMKQFLWRTFENLELNPKIEYINSCCEFCDLILEKIKSAISKKMNINSSIIVIGQEDWGWLLEFQKNEFFYNLCISYQDKDEAKAHNFVVTVEAQKLEKGFFFNRKIESETESGEFAKIIEAIARENRIEVFEE